ncbi:MAG: formyltransferase family protein [Rhodospirillaceae bacterium]
MPDEIILLTGEIEGPHLAAALGQFNPRLAVRHAVTADDLDDAMAQSGGGSGRRLVAFCTGVVVPGRALEALPVPAYNFHPGPPTYPGSWASGFAIYEGAKRFGATLHVMERRVDEGVIVDVDWFDMPENPKLRYDELEVLAYQAALRLFDRYARHLATDDTPLPAADIAWSGKKRSKADVAAMRDLPTDTTEDEIRLRFRAFG